MTEPTTEQKRAVAIAAGMMIWDDGISVNLGHMVKSVTLWSPHKDWSDAAPLVEAFDMDVSANVGSVPGDEYRYGSYSYQPKESIFKAGSTRAEAVWLCALVIAEARAKG